MTFSDSSGIVQDKKKGAGDTGIDRLPTRYDPRLPSVDGTLKGGSAVGPFKVLIAGPKTGVSQRSRRLDNRGRVVRAAPDRWIR